MQRGCGDHQQIAAPGPGGGADAGVDRRARATPSVAIRTPIDFRIVRASLPSAAPTTIVSNGSVDKASGTAAPLS